MSLATIAMTVTIAMPIFVKHRAAMVHAYKDMKDTILKLEIFQYSADDFNQYFLTCFFKAVFLETLFNAIRTIDFEVLKEFVTISMDF